MGKCSNCGRKSLLLKAKRCLFCGKGCCEECGFFVLRIGYQDKVACSPECKKSYEQQVLDHPIEDAGTSLDIRIRENELWYNACFAPMDKNDSSLEAWMRLLKNGRVYAKHILNLETTSSNGRERTDLRERFSTRVLPLLAKAIEARAMAVVHENERSRVLRVQEMKRPLGLTVISIFWFLGSLLNFFIGLGIINADLESMPLLSNPSVPQWFQFGLPAEMILGVFVVIIAAIQILTVYGLLRRKAWSYKMALYAPVLALLISFASLVLYMSAPPRLGLMNRVNPFGFFGALFWLFVYWTYFRKLHVKQYLLRDAPAGSSNSASHSEFC